MTMTENGVHDFVDVEAKAKIKVILVTHLRPIYEKQKDEYNRLIKPCIQDKRSYATYLAEQCGCDVRTIERMMSYGCKKLPTIYTLWMVYDALNVILDEQIVIQDEITNFVKSYIRGQ